MLLTGFAASAAPAFLAHSAELSAQLSAGITRTDNVNLAAAGAEQDETAYILVPAFALIHDGPRLGLDVDYRMQAFRYQERDATSVYHVFDAAAQIDVVPDRVFFDVGGLRSQTLVDPDGAVPQVGLLISDNRIDRDEYFASPSFQLPLGSYVVAAGDLRRSWILFDGDTQENTEDRANFSIDNYRRGRGVTWAIRYDWERAVFDLDEPFEYQTATGELGFWASEGFRFFAAGGQETDWEAPLDPALEDTFWEVGFASTIGEKLTAEFAAGERSFGASFRAQLAYEFRRGSTVLSYVERPTTEGSNRVRRTILDGIQGPVDLLARPGSGRRFILKEFQWGLNLNFKRLDAYLTIGDQRREDLREANGTPLSDQSQLGGNLTLTYRLGVKTDLLLEGSVVERELRAGDVSDLIRVSAAANYRLGPRTIVSLRYEYLEEDGQTNLPLRDNVANVVSIRFIREF